MPIKKSLQMLTFIDCVGSCYNILLRTCVVSFLKKVKMAKLNIKGCGMGTLFVLVSPCFRENVVVTCKVGSFLCSLDNLLQKNVVVFFFGNQISIWRPFEKKASLTYFSHLLATRENLQKFLQHIFHSHT